MGKIKNIVKNLIIKGLDEWDKCMVAHLSKGEMRKISDPKRKSILSETVLSEKQKQKIDKLFIENYGSKIPYYWHQYFTAYTGKFDEAYFPELLFVPEFEHFMNQNESYIDVFADKNIIPMIAKANEIKMPKSFFSCVYGIYRDENNIITKNEFEKRMSNIGRVFVKPSIDSSSGQGCFPINMVNGIDTISGKSVSDISNEIGNNFVVQEMIKCHKCILNIYSKSVNTFRIITYRWNDKIEVMPVIMRIGKGNSVIDNAHAGGMFIAVDETGKLGDIAFTEFRDKFTEHPDTHLTFKDYQIEHYFEIIEAAKKMHTAIPQLGVYNWDFTIDEDGNPVLIEANTIGGSIWMPEMAHGKGVFGENTADILKWTKKMKMISKSKRYL